MRKELTDMFVKNVRPPKTGRSDYADKEVRGLILRVSYTGSKSWSCIYKVPGEGGYSRTGTPLKGIQHRITLGNYPMVTLAEARGNARDIRAEAEKGVDPRDARLQAAKLKYENTVESVAAEMLALDKLRLRRPDKIESAFRNHINPAFGKKPIDEVKLADVNRLIDKYVTLGQNSTALEVKKMCSRLFVFAAERELVPANIMAGLRRKDLKYNKRDRVLEDKEMVALWNAAATVGYPYGDALRLAMLTGCRIGEIKGMSWAEIDLERRALVIPAERYKTKRAHVVPFSDVAWDMIQQMPKHADGDYILSTTKGVRSINADNYMRKHVEELLDEPIENWTPHDMRRTLTTNLARLGVSDRIAEMVTGHVISGTEQTYNRYKYEDEKRDAVQKYGEFLTGLVDGSR